MTKDQAKKIAEHPATQIGGLSGGVVALVLLLIEMGVIPAGTSDADLRARVKQNEDRVRTNELELRELKTVTANPVREAEISSGQQDDLIQAIRDLIAEQRRHDR